MVRENLLGHRGQQGDEVRQGQAHQVTVGGGVQTLGAPDASVVMNKFKLFKIALFCIHIHFLK